MALKAPVNDVNDASLEVFEDPMRRADFDRLHELATKYWVDDLGPAWRAIGEHGRKAVVDAAKVRQATKERGKSESAELDPEAQQEDQDVPTGALIRAKLLAEASRFWQLGYQRPTREHEFRRIAKALIILALASGEQRAVLLGLMPDVAPTSG
jgi:hypothetical protein